MMNYKDNVMEDVSFIELFYKDFSVGGRRSKGILYGGFKEAPIYDQKTDTYKLKLIAKILYVLDNGSERIIDNSNSGVSIPSNFCSPSSGQSLLECKTNIDYPVNLDPVTTVTLSTRQMVGATSYHISPNTFTQAIATHNANNIARNNQAKADKTTYGVLALGAITFAGLGYLWLKATAPAGGSGSSGTSPSSTPSVCTGKLTSDWTEDNKHYYKFELSKGGSPLYYTEWRRESNAWDPLTLSTEGSFHYLYRYSAVGSTSLGWRVERTGRSYIDGIGDTNTSDPLDALKRAASEREDCQIR
ncbi:hypothetical protein [Deinococcus xinjiangensis]